MKNSMVILFAVMAVAVTSAASLPEVPSNLSLDKLDPILQKIIDHFHKVNAERKNEDVYENAAMADTVPEVSQPKVVADDSLEEEYRQKPMNVKALLEKMEVLEKQQQAAAELSDKEDEEDSDVVLSYGLDKPVKFDEVKQDIEEENDKDEEDEIEDNRVPISFGIVAEAIDMTKEVDPDVQLSYGLAEPIEALAVKKDLANEEEEETDQDEEDMESINPVREIKEDEQLDDNEIQVSFGLAEPIAVSAIKNNQPQDADDEDDEEDEAKSTDLNEKIMSQIINSVLKKFAKVHGINL